MRITRYPNISEAQFFGCVSAFVDSLSGELNAATMSLRRLAGSRKGSAFAYEMTLDTHRYGALIVLDRWSTLVGAFGVLMLIAVVFVYGRAARSAAEAEAVIAIAPTAPSRNLYKVSPQPRLIEPTVQASGGARL